MTGTSQPTMAQAVLDAIWSVLNGIHTALPGHVTEYDATKQRASVKPQLKKNFLDGTELSLPVITDVPVVFPRTAKASLTFPVEQGDKVLLVFSERSLEEYLSLGTETKPQDRRKFDLSDAIAILGLYSFADTSPSDGESVELKYQDAKVTIKRDGEMSLDNGSATVVLKTSGQVAINTDGLTVD
jgi:hypothetical protein